MNRWEKVMGMKIGHRTLKTGIAVTLSLIVSNLLKIDSPVYAVIAAILVMQPSVSDSWKRGLDRLLGTIMGAIIGIGFINISPGNPILAGLGTIILIVIMNKFNWTEAITIGTVVFISIFISDRTDYINYAYHRTLDTSIGIIIAVIVNYIIYPPDYYEKVMEDTEKNFTDVLKYSIRCLEVLLYHEEERINVLENQIERIEEVILTSEKLIEIQEKEIKVIPEGHSKYKKMQVSHNMEKEILQHLQNIQDVIEKGINANVIDIVRKDLEEANSLLINLHTWDKNLSEVQKENGEEINLKTIAKKIQKAKSNVKKHENINDYSTDEIIKLLVFLYNFEELLLKLNNISI